MVDLMTMLPLWAEEAHESCKDHSVYKKKLIMYVVVYWFVVQERVVARESARRREVLCLREVRSCCLCDCNAPMCLDPNVRPYLGVPHVPRRGRA